jgi:ribonuclease P protein component
MRTIKLKSLKGHNSFPKVFERGKRFYVANALAVVCFMPANSGCSELMLGLLAGKKLSKSAVMRNRIKRLLKESVRLSIEDFTINGQCPFEVILLSWKKAPSHPRMLRLDDVLPEVRQLLQQAFDYYRNRLSSRGS